MKYLSIPFAIILLAFASCNSKSGESAELVTHEDTLSYALGIMMGKNFEESQITDLNLEVLVQAMRDHRDSVEVIDMETADKFIRDHFEAKEALKAEEQTKKNKEFLDANLKKEGVKVTDSGLQYKVLNMGTGITPDANDSVQVIYHGTLIDGSVFDSSKDRNEPVTFKLDNPMITGFVEGVKMMPEGSKFEFYIPQELGYGERGAGRIEPGSTLIFEIELLKVYSVN